jgi:hypothetical protein
VPGAWPRAGLKSGRGRWPLHLHSPESVYRLGPVERKGGRVTQDFDPYHRWLGIPPSQQPANHYRLLGLELFETDPEVIRDAADRQMGHVRRYQLGPRQELSQRILNELGAARGYLLNPEKRAAYDARLRVELLPAVGESLPEQTPPPSVVFDEATAYPTGTTLSGCDSPLTDDAACAGTLARTTERPSPAGRITCPHCDGHVIDIEVIDLVASAGIPQPQDGARALCPVCGRCCVWEVDRIRGLRLRHPTLEESRRFYGDPAFVAASDDIRERIASKRRRQELGLPPVA